MMDSRSLLRLVLLPGIIAVPAAGVAEPESISFNRDVRPILSDRCFACHGPDAHERKAKLRLDRADGEDGAYRTKDDITGIKPGSLEDSECVVPHHDDGGGRHHASAGGAQEAALEG